MKLQSKPPIPAVTRARPRGWRSLLPGLAIATLAFGLETLGLWEPFERLGYNRLFQLREAMGVQSGWDSRIVVVAIDDDTLQRYGEFPLSRRYYTELLDTLNPSLPGVVGFDILFAEPGPDDNEFAAAIADSWNVVLAIAADAQGRPIELVPQLADAAAAQGHVIVASESDGIVRAISPYQGVSPTLALAMLQIYRESLNMTAQADTSNLDHHLAELAPLAFSSAYVHPNSELLGETQLSSSPPSGPLPAAQIPALQRPPLWINWPGSVRSTPSPATSGANLACDPHQATGELAVYSLACVLERRVEPEAFANAIVLVGVTATGIDALQTPYARNPPSSNVYLHAALIDNLLNDQMLRRTTGWVDGAIALGLGLAATLLFQRQRLTGRLISLAGLPLLWGVGAIALFSYGWWIPVAAPIGTIVLAAVGVQLREQWEKQQLMDLFSLHVAPDAAHLIWQRKGEIFQHGQLEACEMVATILFLDIRGYTTVSERLPSTLLIEWLNRFLSAMTECITAAGGTVDKYIGDEIMAVFGRPEQASTPDQIRHNALQAIAASFAMRKRLQQLNAELVADGHPTIEFGIGIHTGPVIAGSLGGRQRLNYSVIGDTVNVASRLEAINKLVTENNPHKLLVTDATFACVGDRYRSRQIGQFQFKGREQTVLVHAILGERP